MKWISRMIMLLVATWTFQACQKEYSVENGGGVGSFASQWEFKDGTTQFKGPVDTAYIDDFGVVKGMTIEGSSPNGLDAFILEIFAQSFTVGTYKSPQALMSYLRNGTQVTYQVDPTVPNAFEVNITKIDSASVSGTFGGKVLDSSGQVKTITEGKFVAKLKSTVTPPPPPGEGKVTFWAAESCSAGRAMTLQIAGRTGTITSFTATEPTACGAAGTATFTLPVGNYTYKLLCGTDSIGTGSVAITANGCVKVKCSPGGVTPPTNCKLEKIVEYDSASGAASYGYISTFTAQQVTRYQMIDSTTNTVDATFNITYPAGRVQVDANQYFTVGTDGRITQFNGYLDPTDNTSGGVVIKYTYNAAGQMTKAGYELAQAPGIEALQLVYTYTGANLSKFELRTIVGIGTYAKAGEVEYTYDQFLTAKNFICLLAGGELTLFQSAINYGTPSANLLRKAIFREFNPQTGALVSTSVTDFKNYVIGSDNRVMRFNVSGDDFDIIGLFAGYRYNLVYKCF
jgi:hypothetical protein